MFDRIKTRLGSEEGFTLIELLVVIIILGILVAIAVPSYLSFRGKASTAAAQANVRSAIPAAESYYQDPNAGNGSYTGLTGGAAGTLVAQAPGVAASVTVTVSANGKGYCIDDTEGGKSAYYIGGDSTDFSAVTGTISSVTADSTCASVVTA